MLHPFFKVVKKTYIALVMLSNVHYIPAQIPETTPLPGGNQVECLSGLTIKKFSSHNKKWKVVVSGMDIEGNVVKEKIKYKAIGHDPNKILIWKLFSGVGSEDYWDLKPLNSTSWNSTGEAYIPYEKHPANNSDFGEANGIVKLTSGSLSVLSTDPIPNPGKAIKVYFRKDDSNYFDKNVPNWFYYWSKTIHIQNLLSIPGIKLFDKSTCSFNNTISNLSLSIEYDQSLIYNQVGTSTFGYNLFNPERAELWETYESDPTKKSCNKYNEPVRFVCVNYDPKINKIFIGKGCGFVKNSLLGIHALYSTVIHETEHAKIGCEVWKDGYDSLLDTDKDGYRDGWELTDPTAIIFNFKIFKKPIPNPNNLKDDRYDSMYDPLLLGQNKYTAGTEYEEHRCRLQETTSNLSAIDGEDWSFDPPLNKKGETRTILIQGKQW